jgi:hypothetical protein
MFREGIPSFLGSDEISNSNNLSILSAGPGHVHQSQGKKVKTKASARD